MLISGEEKGSFVHSFIHFFPHPVAPARVVHVFVKEKYASQTRPRAPVLGNQGRRRSYLCTSTTAAPEPALPLTLSELFDPFKIKDRCFYLHLQLYLERQ